MLDIDPGCRSLDSWYVDRTAPSLEAFDQKAKENSQLTRSHS